MNKISKKKAADLKAPLNGTEICFRVSAGGKNHVYMAENREFFLKWLEAVRVFAMRTTFPFLDRDTAVPEPDHPIPEETSITIHPPPSGQVCACLSGAAAREGVRLCCFAQTSACACTHTHTRSHTHTLTHTHAHEGRV